jgi:methylphosphotriester-DNA--protein-cysteine methyltransferase
MQGIQCFRTNLEEEEEEEAATVAVAVAMAEAEEEEEKLMRCLLLCHVDLHEFHRVRHF